MATARRCSGCGASLGEPTDDDLTVVCRFCGLRHDLNDLSGAPTAATVVVEFGPRLRRTNTAVLAVVLGIVVIVGGFGLFTAYRTSQRISTVMQQTTTAVQPRVTEPRRPVALDELPGLTEFGWKTVDVTPPPGGYGAFEPVTALPWALTIGRAWAADAVVTRIDVGRVSATGVVDLSGEATSGYRFASAARHLRWRQETDAGAKSTTATALMLQVRGSAVNVIVQNDNRDVPTAPPAASLPLAGILSRARTARAFGDRPFYAGYLIHLPREGWVWYFSAPSGDSFPRVRARDGHAYPY
jgi:hypothetical protein